MISYDFSGNVSYKGRFKVFLILNYFSVSQNLSEVSLASHQRICELNAEVTIKSKENEILEKQLEKNHTELKASQSEITARDMENRKLREEIAARESQSGGKIFELTLELQRATSQLEAFQRLYSQMDVLSSGLDNGTQETFVASGSTPGVIPETFRFKLQQSMDLAHRYTILRESCN